MKSLSRTHLILSTLLVIILAIWFISRPVIQPQIVISTGSGLITDLSSPFGSSGSGQIVFDTTPRQPTWETSSGTKVFFNTNWMGRTVEIQGKQIHYQFGVGNPRETDKSVEEITEMNKRCLNYSPKLCDEKTISLNGEFISVSRKEDGTFEDPERQPSRMTPEIEYLVYSFLSNPIIRQSSESCGEYFWINDGIAQGIYLQHDIGFVHQDNWWNPYNIDINRLIFINPNTGRKELNIDLIWTLRTQILFPSATIETTGHYTNTKLTNCLQKHNQLQLLQSHVASHYERLRQAWNGN